MQQFPGILVYFLLQISKVIGVEEFNQRDPKTVAQHFDGDDPGILTFAVKYVFYGGGRYGRFCGELVSGHVLFFQKCLFRLRSLADLP